MRNYSTLAAIGLGLLLAVSGSNPGSLHAISIGFNPVSQDVFLGNQAMVDVVISGLGDGQAPSLGAFDFVVGFDTSIVSFADGSLGDQLDLGIGSIGGLFLGAPYPAGEINMFEVSLAFLELDDLQDSSFVIASLTFDTLALGTSPLMILPPIDPFSNQRLETPYFGDSSGIPLQILHDLAIDDGSITVINGTAPIPEPSTLLLLGSGLVGIAGLRRRHS